MTKDELAKKDAVIQAMAQYIKNARSYNAACSYKTVDEIIAYYVREAVHDQG